MYKKIGTIVFVILLCVYISLNHSLLYIYTNPYTYTNGLKYISKPIKLMTQIVDKTEKSMNDKGLNLKISYQNAYGSGFLKNNPIPNDLDYMIGVDLGTYEYTGKNKEEISKSLTEKICLFQPTFIYHVNELGANRIFAPDSYISALVKIERKKIFNCINDSLEKAISGERYIKNSQKIAPVDNELIIIDIPYMLQPHEILLNDYSPVELYAKNIRYHKSTPEYLREFMIVIEYKFTIKQGDKQQIITIVPEADFGARLQLERRFFASNVYPNLKSFNFVNNYPLIKNKEDYFFYRMFSFRRHLLESENIFVTEDRLIKLYKRIMQTADAISPMLDKKEYNEISNYVYDNLSNPKIILLNEMSNLISSFFKIYKNIFLYRNIITTEEFSNMCNVYDDIIQKMEEENIDKNLIDNLKKYKNTYLKNVVSNKEIEMKLYAEETGLIKDEINKIIVKNIKNPAKIHEIFKIFNKIFDDIGSRNITVYWIDANNFAMIEDEYTKKIDNFENFAKQNSLPKVNYRLIKEKDIKVSNLKYIMRVRYNPTQKEEENYQKLKQALINDMKNFRPKFKWVFF